MRNKRFTVRRPFYNDEAVLDYQGMSTFNNCNPDGPQHMQGLNKRELMEFLLRGEETPAPSAYHIKTPMELGSQLKQLSLDYGKCSFGLPYNELKANSEFTFKRQFILNQDQLKTQAPPPTYYNVSDSVHRQLSRSKSPAQYTMQQKNPKWCFDPSEDQVDFPPPNLYHVKDEMVKPARYLKKNYHQQSETYSKTGR